MDETIAKSLLIVGCIAAAFTTLTLIIVFIHNIGSESRIDDFHRETVNSDDMEVCQYWSLSAETLPNVSSIVCFNPAGGNVVVVVNTAKTQARCMYTKSANKPYINIDIPRIFNYTTTFFALSNTHVLLVQGTNLNLHLMDLDNNITWSSTVIATALMTTDITAVWFLFEHFVVLTSDFHVVMYSADTLTMAVKTNVAVPITIPKFSVFNNGTNRLCFWSNGVLHLVALDSSTLEITSMSPPGLRVDNVLQLALSADSQTLVACIYSYISDDSTIWVWNMGDFHCEASIKNVRDPAPWQARSGYGMVIVSNKIVIVPSVNVNNTHTKLTKFYLPMAQFQNRQLDLKPESTSPVPAAELVSRFASTIRSSTNTESAVIAFSLDIGSSIEETKTIVKFVKICHQKE